MKKANIVVLFFLAIVLISFVAFLTTSYSFWNSISYLIIPAKPDEYMGRADIIRNLISAVPMLLFTGGIGIASFRHGMKLYHEGHAE